MEVFVKFQYRFQDISLVLQPHLVVFFSSNVMLYHLLFIS